ncbi:MAG TPA: hypothetical protein VGB76_15180 [Pyrinomonadaceae bacterium]|jgi:hypothetical protein
MKNLSGCATLLALIFFVLPFKLHAQSGAPRPSESPSTISADQEIIETRPIDIKGCIRDSRAGQSVIRDAESFQQAIRADASREWCRKNLESIDFTKHSLLGITLMTDYCDRPRGLAHQLIKDTSTKKYLFDISYHTPLAVCRRMGYWDVWVVVPRIPDDYEIVFKVRKIPLNETEQ